jgi:formate dehydrogenase iron-sulfur subunit
VFENLCRGNGGDFMIKVFVPLDSAALSVGAEEVALEIAIQAENNKVDIQIIRTGSRGMLWLEPLVEVETDAGRVGYCNVSVETIPDLMAADFLSGNEHESCIGLVEETEFLKNQDRITFARVGVIDPLSLSDYESHGGLVGLRKALVMPAAEVVLQVTESGLRGRGGAGFPAGIKWQTVLNTQSDQKYICCNADEGDSGTFADRLLMEGDPFTLIEGMIIAGLAVDATQGLIYVRSEYPHAIDILNRAIATANEFGLLGSNVLGSKHAFALEVRVGAGSYVCGEETAMLESLEGKRGMVRAKPPIPALVGLFGKPTVINNVMTLAAVPMILAQGAAAYQELGHERSRGTQVFQLAGNIKRGGVVELAFGVTLGDLVDKIGGGTFSGKPVKTVQVGGPLGAYLGIESWDVAMGYESLAQAGGMLGHGGIVVFDDTANMAKQARFAMEFCAEESCGKCTPCRIGSTRGVEVIDRIVAGEDQEKNLELLEDLCEVMTDGSLCAMGGLTPMPVRSALKLFPADFGIKTGAK